MQDPPRPTCTRKWILIYWTTREAQYMLIYEWYQLEEQEWEEDIISHCIPLQSLLHFWNSCTALRCMASVSNSPRQCMFKLLSFFHCPVTVFCAHVQIQHLRGLYTWIKSTCIVGADRQCQANLSRKVWSTCSASRKAWKHLYFPHPHWDSIRLSDLCHPLNWRNFRLTIFILFYSHFHKRNWGLERFTSSHGPEYFGGRG